MIGTRLWWVLIVGLDRLGPFGASGFDRVRIDRALPQEVILDAQLPGLPLEDLDERQADDAPLLLRLHRIADGIQEVLGGIHEMQVVLQTEILEGVQDRLALVLSHQPVVHMEQVKPLRTEGHTEQFGSHGGVNTAGSQKKHRPLPHLLTDAIDLLLDIVPHAPGRLAPADIQDEVGDHLIAVNRVVHLRVKLEAVAAQAVAADGREAVLSFRLAEHGVAEFLEIRADTRHGIEVAHPDSLPRTEVLEQGMRAAQVHLGQSPFLAAVNHLSAVVLGDFLMPEAKAQYGDVEIEDRLVVGGVLAV